jgi:hypothetical protein
MWTPPLVAFILSWAIYLGGLFRFKRAAPVAAGSERQHGP